MYAWNTAGAIVGSFLTGFVLLPTIGAERTLQIIVAVALALAFGSLVLERGPLAPRFALPAGLAVVLVVAGLVFAPPWDRRLLGAGVYFEPRQHLDPRGGSNLDRVVADYRLVTYTEGYNETIISFQTAKGRFITVNGSPTASDHLEDMFSQRMLGHLPMALHPGPVRTACIVGLGAGVTAGSIAVHEPERLVAIELEKGVFTASRFFSVQNHGILENPQRGDRTRRRPQLAGEDGASASTSSPPPRTSPRSPDRARSTAASTSTSAAGGWRRAA